LGRSGTGRARGRGGARCPEVSGDPGLAGPPDSRAAVARSRRTRTPFEILSCAARECGTATAEWRGRSLIRPKLRRGHSTVRARHRARLRAHDPVRPGQVIDSQVHLMHDLLRQFASVPLALAAYNAGPGRRPPLRLHPPSRDPRLPGQDPPVCSAGADDDLAGTARGFEAPLVEEALGSPPSRGEAVQTGRDALPDRFGDRTTPEAGGAGNVHVPRSRASSCSAQVDSLAAISYNRFVLHLRVVAPSAIKSVRARFALTA